MKALLLAEPGTEQRQTVRTLEEIGVGHVVVAAEWSGFLKAVVGTKPELVLMDLAKLSASGPESVRSAEWTLKALEVPAILLVQSGMEGMRYELEASTEFEHYVGFPPGQFELVNAILALVPSATVHMPRIQAEASPAVDWDDQLAAALSGELDDIGEFDEFLDFPNEDPGAQAATAASLPRAAALKIDAADAMQRLLVTTQNPVVERDVLAGSDRVNTRRSYRTSENLAVGAEQTAVPSGGRSGMTLTAPYETGGRTVQDLYSGNVGRSIDEERDRQQMYLTSEEIPAVEMERIPVRRDAHPGETEQVGRGPATSLALEDTQWQSPPAAQPPTRTPITPAPPQEMYQPQPAAAPRESVTPAVTTATAQPESRVVTVTLTGIRAGMITGIRVPKVLFGLVSNRATGRLRLIQDTLQREVILYRGVIGRLASDTMMADEARLLSTFAWESGSYIFDDANVNGADFMSFGDPFELIFRGIESRLSIDNVMRPLMPFFRTYPVRTTAVRLLKSQGPLGAVIETLERLQSGRTLEQAIVGTGVSPDDTLRRAYFGWLTGALVFESQPREELVLVEYTTDFHDADQEQIANVRRLTDTMSRKRRPSSVSGIPVSNPGASSPGISSTGSDDNSSLNTADARTHNQLSALLEQLRTEAPVTALGLRPGCGVSAVTARYYELARQYHPDRFARGYSPEVADLAQRLFIEIRNVYDRAQQDEQHGTVSEAPQKPAARPASQAPASNPSTSTAPQGVRRVSDILERVRARHATAPTEPAMSTAGINSSPSAVGAGAPPPVAQPSAAKAAAPAAAPNAGFSRPPATATTMMNNDFAQAGQSNRRVPTVAGLTGVHSTIASPDQLFRNAKRALVAGATAKALELVEATIKAGLQSPSVVAHEQYLRYALQELSANQVLPQLEATAGELVEQKSERAQVYVLMGHVYRTEESMDAALDCYGLAVTDDKLNEEANRWSRYLRNRAERQEGGFFNKLLNSKLSLSSPKK